MFNFQQWLVGSLAVATLTLQPSNTEASREQGLRGTMVAAKGTRGAVAEEQRVLKGGKNAGGGGGKMKFYDFYFAEIGDTAETPKLYQVSGSTSSIEPTVTVNGETFLLHISCSDDFSGSDEASGVSQGLTELAGKVKDGVPLGPMVANGLYVYAWAIVKTDGDESKTCDGIVCPTGDPSNCIDGTTTPFTPITGDDTNNYSFPDGIFDPLPTQQQTAPSDPFMGTEEMEEAPVVPPGGIVGTIWYDTNGDGLPDGNEDVRPGQLLYLVDEEGNKVETTTDQNGKYEFSDLATDGTYIVQVPFDSEEFTVTTISDETDNVGEDGESAPLVLTPGVVTESNAGLLELSESGLDMLPTDPNFMPGDAFQGDEYEEDPMGGIKGGIFVNNDHLTGSP